jgi:trimeric autotransporter adhesin
VGNAALSATSSGGNNIGLGFRAGSSLTTGSNNIDIGSNVVGVAGESNTIRIGNTQITATFIRGISGQTAVGGAAVFVNSNGKLGTMTSSARFKETIKPMDKASEAILALKPVTFRYKKEIDADRTPQFGLVAEDVERVNPDLVVKDTQGKVYTVRYEAVNAMLLNEFLKEHRKVEKLEATVAQQRKDFETAIAQVKAQVQKVSAQLELSKAAPQTVKNND